MPWRWVGLADDQNGASNKARITDDGELLVKLLSGGVGASGEVEIIGIAVDLPVKPAVGSADFPVNISTVTGDVPVQISGSDVTIPVSVTEPLSVEVASGTVTTGPVAETGFGGGPGTVVAPAADTVITNHFPGVAGELHMIEVVTWFSEGTPTAADNYNMGFKFGGTLIAPIPVVAAINVPTTSRFYFNSAAGTPFGVHSIDAGTAGVGYNAFLTATRVA